MSVEAVSLRSGPLTAAVSAHGGRLVGLHDEQTSLIVGRGAPETFGSALLAPWPNVALDHGRWSWRGRTLQLPGTGVRLHGLVHSAGFALRQLAADSASCRMRLLPAGGYPFDLDITASYRLTGSGMVASVAAMNRGQEDAPVGLGVHPYLLASQGVDELAVRASASAAFQVGASRLEPVPLPACVAGTWHRIGPAALDHALLPGERRRDGTVGIDVRTPTHELRVWGGSTCRWLMVYTADDSPGAERRGGLAVEPMTCPPDALRSGAVDVLEPEQTLELVWGIEVLRRLDQATAR